MKKDYEKINNQKINEAKFKKRRARRKTIRDLIRKKNKDKALIDILIKI